jgi:putative ABC transport system ATP-binding protein
MKQTIIVAEQINKIFGRGESAFQALKDVSLSIESNTLSILKGRSGSGKTTLINMLGALDYPSSGNIFISGKDIVEFSESKREKLRRKEIGFIFQSVSLIPMMTAFENVEFALRLSGDKNKRKERVETCLNLVGLGSRMHHMPQELSGGEQQRVAIARAIVHQPAIIFADEPTAELDSNTSKQVVNLFQDLVKKEGLTIVMTTHDMTLMGAGDKVFELEDGVLLNG